MSIRIGFEAKTQFKSVYDQVENGEHTRSDFSRKTFNDYNREVIYNLGTKLRQMPEGAARIEVVLDSAYGIGRMGAMQQTATDERTVRTHLASLKVLLDTDNAALNAEINAIINRIDIDPFVAVKPGQGDVKRFFFSLIEDPVTPGLITEAEVVALKLFAGIDGPNDQVMPGEEMSAKQWLQDRSNQWKDGEVFANETAFLALHRYSRGLG